MTMTDAELLEALHDRRIFNVTPRVGGLEIQESCDCYFRVALTANEVRQLAQALVAAAESLPGELQQSAARRYFEED